MKKLSLLLLSLAVVSLVLTGCKKSNDRKNYLQVGNEVYDLALGDMEYYGTATGGYDIGLNLLTTGITVDADGYWQGTGTGIWFEFISDINNGLSSGTYEYSGSSVAFTLYDVGYCLDWTTNYETNVWVYLDSSEGGYVKVVKNGTKYEVTFKGKDEDGNAVKGNFSGTFAIYDFSSTKSRGSHK
ncbi:MAG TPA: hypothetical protein PKH02_03605 [Bacteroidales bacterium]|nr:hypothetical protein [Bacteroidales bacterium]